jgi:hypothetical protein
VSTFFFKVRSECSECGEAMILDGPTLAKRCLACQSNVEIEAVYWQRMMAFRHDPELQGCKIVSTAFALGGSSPLRVRMGKQEPTCQGCNHALDVGSAATGTDGEIPCECGQKMPTFPVPAWLRRLEPKAVQLFNAAREERGHGTPIVVPREDRPVSFGCPDCGANLKVGMESPRILACEFCRADLFLPDALWHALHPVKKRSAWYVRFD